MLQKKAKKERSGRELKYSLCSFETNSKLGLKIHIRKKHTAKDNDTFPKNRPSL
jgi:hypothetical protein